MQNGPVKSAINANSNSHTSIGSRFTDLNTESELIPNNHVASNDENDAANMGVTKESNAQIPPKYADAGPRRNGRKKGQNSGNHALKSGNSLRKNEVFNVAADPKGKRRVTFNVQVSNAANNTNGDSANADVQALNAEGQSQEDIALADGPRGENIIERNNNSLLSRFKATSLRQTK